MFWRNFFLDIKRLSNQLNISSSLYAFISSNHQQNSNKCKITPWTHSVRKLPRVHQLCLVTDTNCGISQEIRKHSDTFSYWNVIYISLDIFFALLNLNNQCNLHLIFYVEICLTKPAYDLRLIFWLCILFSWYHFFKQSSKPIISFIIERNLVFR